MKKISVDGIKVRRVDPASRITPLSKTNSLEMQYHPITQDASPALADFISGYGRDIGPAKYLVLSAQYALCQI